MEISDLENRFTYHKVNEEKQDRMADLREEFLRISLMINDLTPESREKSLAITHLEESMFWAIASIAREK